MLQDKHRILIVGPSGAGKSTLATKLGAALHLPVIHLDQHFWQSGWKQTPDAEWDGVLAELLATPQWIMDGNYDRTLIARLQRADAVIFLDLSPWTCRYRVVKRIVSSYGRVRRDMAPGCPEQWDWSFLRWVWNWHRDVRPVVVGALDQAPPAIQVLCLRSRREVAQLAGAARR